MKIQYLGISVLLYLGLFGLVNSKYIKKTIYIPNFLETNFKYITKFSIDIGIGKYEVQGKIHLSRPKEKPEAIESATLHLHVIVDEDWERTLSLCTYFLNKTLK